MQIHKTTPEDSRQWQSDSPSVKGMRLLMPIAALLSAVSLAGGIASFFQVGLTTTAGICLIVALAVAAWRFDALAVSSGQSVVREIILAFIRKEVTVDVLFWVNLVFAAIICAAMVFGSFQMSRNGISYLVLEVRKAKEIHTQTDTVLTSTIAGAANESAGILQAKQEAYNAQVAAINTAYAGKIEALEADVVRREKQKNADNRQNIDQQVQKLKKRIGDAKAEQGEKLAALAATFAADQARILAGNEQLQAVVIDDAKAAAGRRKLQQDQKDQADLMLSGLVSSIFAWSVVLMLVIGLRLALLETRNGILPNPILRNEDISGSAMMLRFILSIPNFVFACLNWLSERLYVLAPKRPTPVVDSDVVDFHAAQMEVVAIRKEGKTRKLAAAERREIGFRKVGSEVEKVGSEISGSTEKVGSENLVPEQKKLANKGGKFSEPKKLVPVKVGSTEDAEMDPAQRELIQQIKFAKKELTKYKKRQSASYQKILADQKVGNEPKAQQLNAYENRTAKVEELTAQVQALEAQLKSMP